MKIDTQNGAVTLFESHSLLGFVFDFPGPAELLSQWREASQAVLKERQFALRSADRKAWNTYLVFLSEAPANFGQISLLNEIEEDLVGTRKIAAAGVNNDKAIRDALLPLISLQSAPRIEPVYMLSEIRLRTSELPKAIVDAFLAEASEATLQHLLENAE
ncbi:MAG: hypothetical protein LAT56_14585 [Wenzhouxiangella sp.]|nr:hypothetical protein [Wenzhouxiangella sp.]